MIVTLGPIDAQSAAAMPLQLASKFFEPLRACVGEVTLPAGNTLQESSLLELIVNRHRELSSQVVIAGPGGSQRFPLARLAGLDSWRRRQLPQSLDGCADFSVCHSVIAVTPLGLDAE